MFSRLDKRFHSSIEENCGCKRCTERCVDDSADVLSPSPQQKMEEPDTDTSCSALSRRSSFVFIISLHLCYPRCNIVQSSPLFHSNRCFNPEMAELIAVQWKDVIIDKSDDLRQGPLTDGCRRKTITTWGHRSPGNELVAKRCSWCRSGSRPVTPDSENQGRGFESWLEYNSLWMWHVFIYRTDRQWFFF